MREGPLFWDINRKCWHLTFSNVAGMIYFDGLFVLYFCGMNRRGVDSLEVTQLTRSRAPAAPHCSRRRRVSSNMWTWAQPVTQHRPVTAGNLPSAILCVSSRGSFKCFKKDWFLVSSNTKRVILDWWENYPNNFNGKILHSLYNILSF